MNQYQPNDRTVFHDTSRLNTQPERDDEIDLPALLGTLWRGKFWIALCGALALAVGIWYAFIFATPMYTSSATVALESRQEQVVDIESVVTGLSGDQATINTEVEVIRSRGLMEKLAQRLDLEKDPEFNAALRPKPRFSVTATINSLVAMLPFGDWSADFAGASDDLSVSSDRETIDRVIDVLLKKVSVSNIRQSYVFRITAVTESPTKSAEIANALAELYILEQLETKFEATEQATTWLTERVAELQIQLEDAEAAVKDFNAQTELVSVEALAGLNVQIKELRDRLRDTNSEKAAVEESLQELGEAAAGQDIEKMAEVANDQTLNRVLQLMQRSDEAEPDRTAFDARFEQILTRSALELARANDQISALQETIAQQEKQIEEQSADLVQLEQLQREAEASRLIYEFFLNRLKETSVQEGIQQADSRVLSRAVVPTEKSAPRKSMILALSLALGLFAGSAAVLGREMTQTTFRDASELEARSGYTVIGQIPVIPARRRRNVLKYFVDKPTSAAAEAIRNLRTSVLLSNIDKPPQVLMSTSSIPSEGKTTQSMALALNLSGLGKKVLLVEGDIRRRIFSQYFDISASEGLLAVLSGGLPLSDAVQRVESLGADVLIGEKAQTNAADIFSSDRFAQFVLGARETYDYIIIDTPPVLAVPDARIIGNHVDAIIYTVKWDSTSHRQVLDGLKSFEDVNIRISGLVLGQVNARGMKKYGYGYSYGAYNEYYDN